VSQQPVYIVCADGDDELANQLTDPLCEAGYTVVHNGTIAIGESLVGEAQRALASGSPIVLCATAKAVGSAWAHQIVNAAHSDGPTRVFVVQMEKQAFVKQLALDGKVARYCDDPGQAVVDLLNALAKHFPPPEEALTSVADLPASTDGVEFLDQLTDCVTFDFEDLDKFRRNLRRELTGRYPEGLTPWEFLDRAGLRRDGRLSRTGALLFARSSAAMLPMAIVKCTRYKGEDRSAERDTLTFDGSILAQIEGARQFVADRVQVGETPSADQARSVTLYEYPMVAVREIIANALVHRDYTAAESCAHVRLFSNRLEVSSPGTWLSRTLLAGPEYELAELEGQSIKRNFHLAHILSWTRLVEGEGSGIPSAIYDCQADESPAPTVRQEQGFVTVTLFKKPKPADILEQAPRRKHATFGEALRQAIRNADYTQIGLAHELELDPSKVSRWINDKAVPHSDVMHRIEGILNADLTDSFSAAVPEYELFISAPLIGLEARNVSENQDAIPRLLTVINHHVNSLYWPGERIRAAADIANPDVVTEQNMTALANCSACLYLQFSELQYPSSALVELGFALGRRLKTTVIIKRGLDYPYMLRNFSAVAATLKFLPNVRIYEVGSAEDAESLIKRNGRELLGLS
jgi:predicted HTH transcriptional regulator